jgi:peptidoglycan/LPS O-acetylase OafA/YrhL
MVFIASFGKGYALPDGLLKRIMVYVGSRSFALYLSHNPMFFVTGEIFHCLYPDVAFDNRFAFGSLSSLRVYLLPEQSCLTGLLKRP